MGFLTWVVLVFFAGSSDRLFVFLGLSYVTQIWFWRVAVWVIPVVVAFAAHRTCLALQRFEAVEAARHVEPPRADEAAAPPAAVHATERSRR
jgi:ubiquinol-cytochrome c reductase cytochrome b subunit